MPSRSNRWFIFPALCLFGAAMFFGGRFSAPSRVAQINSAPSVVDSISPQKVAAPEVTPAPVEKIKSSAPALVREPDWQQLSSQPRTPARVSALAAMLERLAASDPTRAMALAQAEGNLQTRDIFTQAVLRGWASTAPENAANWALNLTDDNAREAAMASVFAGAAADPDAAIRVATLACDKDADQAIGFGDSLIDTFCKDGNFEAAARFAATADGNRRSFWLAEAYSKWSALQPEQAAQAVLAISDPDERNEALHGIIGGWSTADPVALTHFIAQQPDGGEHGAMLGQALESWVRVDPVAAAEWMNASAKSTDMDEGEAAVARMNDLKSEVAVGWAESITDKTLRSQVLGDVLRGWALADPTAAKHYFDTSANLQPAERQQISEILATADQLSNNSSPAVNAN
ncbi:MAG TPA: hypothetical protein VH255_04795 [Verrucomicrobiae bacterium]|nr:hypothetical protein [Verrucomicrobiae bacterium]